MYLIKNVTLYDPMLRGTCNLLISGEQIVAVGKDLQPAIPGIKEIDGTGKTAVPGFIDQHVHVTGGTSAVIYYQSRGYYCSGTAGNR